MIGYLLAAFVGWGLIAWYVDRIDQPAFVTRDFYQGLSLILIVFLALVVWRGESYHRELVVLIEACR